jgi:hypothetical protein
MKKTFILSAILLALFSADADAQFLIKKKKKKDFQETEQEGTKPNEFQVDGFARDRDERIVRRKDANQDQLNGFDNDAYLARNAQEAKPEEKPKENAKTKKSKSKKGATPASSAAKKSRNRDIEGLMTEIVLAKIQRPVFRGIMTEHLRDVTKLMNNETLDNSERNVLLKQLYALRNKRISEVLNDEQFRKWLNIKDEDEFLDLPVPEEA